MIANGVYFEVVPSGALFVIRRVCDGVVQPHMFWKTEAEAETLCKQMNEEEYDWHKAHA